MYQIIWFLFCKFKTVYTTCKECFSWLLLYVEKKSCSSFWVGAGLLCIWQRSCTTLQFESFKKCNVIPMNRSRYHSRISLMNFPSPIRPLSSFGLERKHKVCPCLRMQQLNQALFCTVSDFGAFELHVLSNLFVRWGWGSDYFRPAHYFKQLLYGLFGFWSVFCQAHYALM